MSTDLNNTDVLQTSSRHMSCKQLREKIEVEMDDNNSVNVEAKRQLDAL